MNARKIAVFAGCLALAGCVTSHPQSVGRDTYLVETMGTNMTYEPALRKANAFCAQQGKKMQMVNGSIGGFGISANASITFMCLEESDPRYGQH